MQPASQLSRQQILLNVARDLSSAENAQQLLDRILECSREVMDCEVCSVLLPESAKPDADLLIRSTRGGEVIRVPAGKGIAGEVYREKKVVSISDAQQDPRHFSKAGEKAGLVARAMVSIPLLEGDRCLGVMQAINPNLRNGFDEGDIELFETFGSLIAVALIRLEASVQAIREAEIRQQMALANDIQQSFLPPETAQIGTIRINAFYRPASEIGGDFYFWHELEEDRILLGIGDVCGKGFPAALDMARGATMIAALSNLANDMDLGDWVSEFNSSLCGVMSAGRFIAFCFFLIDPNSRKISVSTCGLLPPRYLKDGRWQQVPHRPNPPLGISGAVRYASDTLSLDESRKWLIYSDGILETQNQAGEHFEDHQFEATLVQIAEADVDVLPSLIQAWEEFSEEASYQDDTTVLSFEDTSGSPPNVFAFDCRPDCLKEGRDFVDAWASHAGFDPETAGLIVLGCDEIFTNIVKHAYPDMEGGPARCEMALKDDALRVEIYHSGEGIEDIELPREINPCEKIGGLGLSVVNQVFDEVDFTCTPHPRITLVKKCG